MKRKSICSSDKITDEDGEVKQGRCLREKFAQSVSLQGLPYVLGFGVHPVRRLFWTILLCGAIAFTAFNLFENFTRYLSKPIAVSINMMGEEEQGFPKVTLCNFNSLSQRVINATPGALDTAKIILPLPFSEHPNPVFDNTSILWYYGELMGWRALYRSFAVKPLKMIVSCTWEGLPCVDGFFEETLTDLGVCIQTNVSKNLTANSSGRDYGLQLILDADQEDYFNPRHTLYGAGFKIAIHTHDTPGRMRKIAYSAGAGMYNSMSVKMKKRTDLKPSVTLCNDRPLKYFNEYSIQACQLECLIDFILQNCGCVENYMAPDHLSHIEVCNPALYYGCIMPKFREFIKNESECMKTCMQACTEVQYSVTMSQAPLSNFFLDEFSAVYTSKGKLAENLVLVDIFFSDLGYEFMTRDEAYGVFSFFCDVGGALGLITGASVLTFFEIGDFVFGLVYNARMWYSSKTKVRTLRPEKTFFSTSIHEIKGAHR